MLSGKTLLAACIGGIDTGWAMDQDRDTAHQ